MAHVQNVVVVLLVMVIVLLSVTLRTRVCRSRRPGRLETASALNRAISCRKAEAKQQQLTAS